MKFNNVFVSIRRYKYVVIITSILLIVIIGLRIYLNATHYIWDGITEISFSVESGFYADEFDLEIKSNGGSIFYTLDGSVPTKESTLYQGPIHIYDNSFEDNIYASRTDVSTGFDIEHLRQYCGIEEAIYSPPDYPVDKCMVVRAIVYYGDEKYSDVKTGSYFIGYNSREGYDGVGVVSLITDPDNLFGYENGIYVTGEKYDEYLDNTDFETAWAAPYWWWWNANYRMREYDSEREATLQFFLDGECVYYKECGIRIHGGGSRGSNPKSLNLYARAEYDGNTKFNYDFFDNGYNAQRLTLFQGGDDTTKMKDYVFSNLVATLDVSTFDFRPYALFIDGEYWGIYWLNEKYDECYFSYYYNVHPDNIVVIKNGNVEAGDEKDIELYQELIDYVSNSDLNDKEVYERLAEMIDVDSFVDYYASFIYVSRTADWPWNNYALWRSRSRGEGQYNDGRWRWIVFDVNSTCLDESLIEYDSFSRAMEDDFFSAMMKCDVLRNRVLDRMVELRDTVFSAQNIESVVKEYHDIMDEPMKLDCIRFRGSDSYKNYLDSTDSIEHFLYERGNYIEQMVEQYR